MVAKIPTKEKDFFFPFPASKTTMLRRNNGALNTAGKK
jgi:hypothetical protein